LLKNLQRQRMQALFGKNGNGKPALNEAAAATLLINTPEAFLFFPLVDDAHRCEEQQNDNSHVTVDRAENIVEGHISKRGDGRHAEVASRIVCLLNERRVRAEFTTNFSKVGRVEIAAAFELVLDRDACLAREVRKDDMEVGTLLKSVHPDEGTDHKDEESVEDEDPVEEHKTAKNMGWLNNGSNGNYPSNEQRNGEDKTRCQIRRAQDHVQEQVRTPPHD